MRSPSKIKNAFIINWDDYLAGSCKLGIAGHSGGIPVCMAGNEIDLLISRVQKQALN